MKVSYTKEDRQKAKAEGKGLVCLDIVHKDGSRATIQGVADDRGIDIVSKAMNELTAKEYKTKCKWRWWSETGCYSTECKEARCFEENDVINAVGYKYYPYCGKEIEVVE